MTFMAYSFIGWLWESVFCSIQSKHFVYRGFLLGPYCPVYGFGVTAVLLLVSNNTHSLISLYFSTVFIVTVVEYITSWILEKLFDMKLWDYSNMPMNIDGRVAVPISLLWGVGCVILIKFINPPIQTVIQNFNTTTKDIGPLVICIIFMADVVSTLIFTATTKKEVQSALDDAQNNPDNAGVKEYRLKHLLDNKPTDTGKKVLASFKGKAMKLRHHSLSRIIKNYPHIVFDHKNKSK